MKLWRAILIEFVVLVVVAALAGVVYYLWYQNQHYVSTSDAQVTGNLVTLYSPTSGVVSQVKVAVGQYVRAGQVLAVLRDPAAPSSVASVRRLGAHLPVPAAIPIRATVTGRVAQVVPQGDEVAPGVQLATLVNLHDVWITANVPETRIRHVHVGQPVDVWIDAYPSDTFHGTVWAIQPATQSEFALIPSFNASGTFTKVTQRIPVLIRLDDLQGRNLYPGLSAEVRISVDG